MRRSTLLGLAFAVWTVGGPVLAQVLTVVAAEAVKSPIPSALAWILPPASGTAGP